MVSFKRAHRMAVPIFACVFAGVFALGSCGGEDYGESGADFDPGGVVPDCFSSNECEAGFTCSEFGTCEPPNPGGGEEPPPVEVEFELPEPVSSNRFLFVPMPELDALARIDGETLSVASVSVGERPKAVASGQGTDTAVVLDSVNGTATIVRAVDGGSATKVLKTLPKLNRVVMSPDARYAVAWFDLAVAVEEAGGLGANFDVGSFQDVTVLRIGEGSEVAVDLTVGFRPRDVQFDAAGTHAFVLTDDGVSVIDLDGTILSGPTIVPAESITGDPVLEENLTDVTIVPSGEFAVARSVGMAELHIAGMTGASVGWRQVIALSAPATDVDISRDGTLAYVVLRDVAELAVVELSTGQVTTTDLGAETVGSLVLSKDGTRAALFTNASAIERLTIVDFANGNSVTSHSLQKSVRWVAFSPDGARVFVSHAKTTPAADADPFDAFVDDSYGYSVFDTASGFAKLQLTPVDVRGVAFAPSGAKAYIALDGGDDVDAIAALHIANLQSGVIAQVDLGSGPETVGILPGAEVAFVSQRHALGRVSFIDFETDDVQTITGFDLNSQVID